jgi:hypothetical protein
MQQVNAMRAVLVAGAVIAALLTAALGQWSAAVLLAIGVAGHALLWRHLRRNRDAEAAPATRAE